MELNKEDIRKELYEFGCGYMLDEYMELFNKIGKIYHEKQLSIHGVSKRLSIKLEDWHYQCGDGCCDLYGTEITLNGKKCDNQYAGDDVRTALEFILTELGYKVDIDVC